MKLLIDSNKIRPCIRLPRIVHRNIYTHAMALRCEDHATGKSPRGSSSGVRWENIPTTLSIHGSHRWVQPLFHNMYLNVPATRKVLLIGIVSWLSDVLRMHKYALQWVPLKGGGSEWASRVCGEKRPRVRERESSRWQDSHKEARPYKRAINISANVCIV